MKTDKLVKELDFTKALIIELLKHNIYHFNIIELESELYYYCISPSIFTPLFKELKFSDNRLDLSEDIWRLSALGIVYFNYPYVDIRKDANISYLTNLKLSSNNIELLHNLIENYLLKKDNEAKAPILMNIIETEPSNEEYPIIEGLINGSYIRLNIITDGDIIKKEIPEYCLEEEIITNTVTVKNATYVIQLRYVNDILTQYDIYTKIKDKNELEKIKNIALDQKDSSVCLMKVRAS